MAILLIFCLAFDIATRPWGNIFIFIVPGPITIYNYLHRLEPLIYVFILPLVVVGGVRHIHIPPRYRNIVELGHALIYSRIRAKSSFWSQNEDDYGRKVFLCVFLWHAQSIIVIVIVTALITITTTTIIIIAIIINCIY